MPVTNSLVSVIMPVFNGGDLLRLALQSIRLQDYPHLEIIAIDDGSRDGSAQVLDTFAASYQGRLKILTHPGRQQRGIAASYRLGLEHCQGEYIAFLEQDDVWPRHKISAQISIFTAWPEVGVVFSDVYSCDEAGRIAAEALTSLVNRPPTARPFHAFWRLLWGNCIYTFSNFMVRSRHIQSRDIIAEPEGFQDWMLVLLLSRRCQFYYCHLTKTFWRQRPESYFAQISQLPTFRRIRKRALSSALTRVLADDSPHPGHAFYTGPGASLYWQGIITLFSALERTASSIRCTVGAQGTSAGGYGGPRHSAPGKCDARPHPDNMLLKELDIPLEQQASQREPLHHTLVQD